MTSTSTTPAPAAPPRIPAQALMHGHCRHCAQPMVFQPRCGWVVLHPGDTYDICPENEYGPHEPDLYAAEEQVGGRR